jgi:small subunit ribosomal protein S16
MLAIRMQRIGRKGHAQYRVIVQDRRFSPKSGRVVVQVGTYNPHAKAVVLDNDKISGYLKNGAQPSGAVVQILKKEGVKLPTWVAKSAKQKRQVRNPEKLRRNQPADPEANAANKEPQTETAPADTPAEESPAAEATTEATPSEESSPEPSSEEAKAEPEPKAKSQ